ncbi:MAG: DUF3798 domain-containing protein [Chloroflexota bacterium]
MSRRVVALLLILCLAAGLATATAGCGSTKKFKVGIITGTVSQGEDEYRAAERMKAKYGERVVTATYPDNFMAEMETYISIVKGMAQDKSVKAIVICQAVPGTKAAIEQIRKTRKDIVFLLGVPHEDPGVIDGQAEVIVNTDELARGKTIVAIAKQLGAKTFVHYSFPRHMSMELLAQRRDIFAAECQKLGIEFVDATAPDPMGPSGLPGAQQYILEDVPRMVARYGKDTAFFSTNCGMQEPLIKATLEAGGIFPEQCCPSPTHGYPGALGIDVAGLSFDFPAIVKAIDEKIVSGGGAGRFATWPIPINFLTVQAETELAFDYIDKKIDKLDPAAVEAKFEELAGVPMDFTLYAPGGTFSLCTAGSIVFGQLSK